MMQLLRSSWRERHRSPHRTRGRISEACLVALLLLGLPLRDTHATLDARFVAVEREIYPARLNVWRLDAGGDLEALVLHPSGREVIDVRRGRLPAADTLLAALAEAGFFEWADSSLVPPHGLDVDSPPLRVELRFEARARTVFTREPHLPPALGTLIDSLRAVSARAQAVDRAVVCVPEIARTVPADAIVGADAAHDPELRRVVQSLSGPFPVLLDPDEADTLRRRHGLTFAIRTEDASYSIHCLTWSRPPPHQGH